MSAPQRRFGSRPEPRSPRPREAPGTARALRAGVAVTLLLTGGCSSVQVRYPDGSTEYQSTEEFAAYVEHVFRYHNRVVNDLIVSTSLMGDGELETGSPLLRAEEAMAAICQPLNQTVSASIEGREISLFEKLRLPEAVPACETASRRLEALLPPGP